MVAGVPRTTATGGAVRAKYLLRSLIGETRAPVVGAWGRRGLPALAFRTALESGWWRRHLQLASLQLLPGAGLVLLRGRVHGRLLDLHDHPGLQLDAVGMTVPAGVRRRLDELTKSNIAAFELLAVPSKSFAELCELEVDRVVVATNGTDTRRIQPTPGAAEPVVSMVSGAAPGRGIELLVSAVEALRQEVPEIRLRLALQPTGPASDAYLDELRRTTRERPWVSVQRVAYEDLSGFLGAAALLAIPHPPHPYLDAATPVKLFDGMAAGRPTVATPRLETARILQRRDAGLVTAGDSVDDLAAAILRLLMDEALRNRLGANARQAAVDEFDWLIISERLARDVLHNDPDRRA